MRLLLTSVTSVVLVLALGSGCRSESQACISVAVQESAFREALVMQLEKRKIPHEVDGESVCYSPAYWREVNELLLATDQALYPSGQIRYVRFSRGDGTLEQRLAAEGIEFRFHQSNNVVMIEVSGADIGRANEIADEVLKEAIERSEESEENR